MDLQHVVEQMIAAGADLNAVDKNNKTALIYALSCADPDPDLAISRTPRVPSSIGITLIEAGENLVQLH